MRRIPPLGYVNLALVALYFAPLWGKDALRALAFPYSAFENPAHAAVAIEIRELFDFRLEGLLRVSNALAGLKLVIAAGLLAYLIEFARSLAVGRDIDRVTGHGVLALAVLGGAIWIVPGLLLADPALVRISATQLMLLAGAAVIAVLDPYMGPTAKADCLVTAPAQAYPAN
ncbi:MAG TPA: hypothetical protein VH684_13265 [Xanthobacteraceae bacterium]|jgi:hypothetical protein